MQSPLAGKAHAPKVSFLALLLRISVIVDAVSPSTIRLKRASTITEIRSLLRMPVRGLTKARSVVGLFVLAHNLIRIVALAPHLIGWRTSPSAMAAQVA